MTGSGVMTTPAACMPAWRESPSSREPISMMRSTSLSFFIASISAGDSFAAIGSVTSGPAGIVFATLSTRPYGSPSTRPTSRTTDFAAIVPKVMICATLSSPYLRADVLDHLAAAVHAEVDVDVGHRDALGIEEALEEKVVVERIDVGDAHRVRDQRSRAGAAARTDRDAVVFRVLDEVPDHEEVAGEAHRLDDVDLALEPVVVLLRLVLFLLRGEERRGRLEPALQPRARDLGEVAGQVLPLGHREVRQVIALDVERDVACARRSSPCCRAPRG